LEELRCKNEEELNALREENQRMRMQIEQNSQQREESHIMKKEGTTQGETSPEYRPPPTKQARDPKQPDATPSWMGSWRWNSPHAGRG